MLGSTPTFTEKLLFGLGIEENFQAMLKKDFHRGMMMNEVLDYLLLIAVLGLGAIWTTAVFCYFVFLLGVYDD